MDKEIKSKKWDTICFFIGIAALSLILAKWAAEKLHDTNRLPKPAIVTLLNNDTPIIQKKQIPVHEEIVNEPYPDIDTLNRDIQKEADSLYSYQVKKPDLANEEKNEMDASLSSTMFESDKPIFPEPLRLVPEKNNNTNSQIESEPSLVSSSSDLNNDPGENLSRTAFQKGFHVEGIMKSEESTLTIAEVKNNKVKDTAPAPSPFKNVSQEDNTTSEKSPLVTVKTLKPVILQENTDYVSDADIKKNSDTTLTVVLESNEIVTPSITVKNEATPVPVNTQISVPVNNPDKIPVVALPVITADQTIAKNNESPAIISDTLVEKEKTVQSEITEKSTASTETAISVLVPLDIWIVSSPCCLVSDVHSLQFQQWDQCQWHVSDFDHFNASNSSDVSNVIFIHGNWTDMEKAVNDGWYLKQRLQTMTDAGPIRLIIWKWHSEKVFRNIRQDSQFKAELADQDGKNLAVFLNSANMPGPVTLIGFSFGARTIGSALMQPQVSSDDHKKNVLLVSAATDSCDFHAVGKYGSSLEKINRLIHLYNPEDKALRFYPLLYGRGGCPALGTMPFNCCGLTPELHNNIVSINTMCCGNQHRFSRFMQCMGNAQFRTLIQR